jgi:hypothetical protein
LEEESERLRVRRDVEQAAADWDGHGRSDAYLWRYERLENGLQLMEKETWSQDDVRRLFLEVSQARDRARLERESEQLAIRVLRDDAEEPELGIVLALAAIEEYTWTPRAELALNTSINASRVRGDLRHETRVRTAAFSPDGTRIVTASDDTTVRFWDASTGYEILFPAKEVGPLYGITIDANGTEVVSVSVDRTPQAWRPLTGDELIAFAKTRVTRELTEKERREYGLPPRKAVISNR